MPCRAPPSVMRALRCTRRTQPAVLCRGFFGDICKRAIGSRFDADDALKYRPMRPAFIHLRLHSEYSIVDGIVRVDEAVAAAKADGMPALALNDHGKEFGMHKCYKAAGG